MCPLPLPCSQHRVSDVLLPGWKKARRRVYVNKKTWLVIFVVVFLNKNKRNSFTMLSCFCTRGENNFAGACTLEKGGSDAAITFR